MRFFLETVAWTILFTGIALGLAWFGYDWFHNRQENATLMATVIAQDRTITSNGHTIESQKQTIETWKEHYERLRWQQRTTPPNQPRKGVK